jgi:CAAX protease family protein
MIEENSAVDTETENEQASDGSDFYDGSWEKKGRSPVAASILVLMGVGAFYFNAQTILSIPVMVFGQIATRMSPEDLTFVERISEVMRMLAFPIQLLLIVSQFAFLLIPTLYLVKRLHTSRIREYLRFSGFRVFEILVAIAITIAIIPTTTFIANIISKWLEIPEWIANLGVELFTAHSPGEFVWLIIVIAVTPAICEEVLFRAYAQRTLERKLGAKSFWIIGIIFGLFHMQPIGLISLSMMGVVFGYLFYRSKSIFPSMAAHFTNNALVVYLLYSGLTIGGVDIVSLDEIPLMWVVVSVVVSASLLYLYHFITRPVQPAQT